ncbi:beta-glucosidase [Rhizomicrobium palustre]|uniref:beta-glucosidase n=1 Tax=Rhizomicrobium palustre TaxID=189966 RepID=A0A846N151_9PROT|nr:glycoside hydrolase family 3 N-terminal domain-containing protein [Rhizomicrobium palustre]NIK88880.1 beta-glucosidase [Rhizomicrobium palustre]
MEKSITRRSAMLAAALTAAWGSSPIRALAAASTGKSPTLDALLAQMTLEEKAGQLTLMPAAVDGRVATFNPAQPDASFQKQFADARAGRLTGLLNTPSLEAMRMFQDVATKQSRLRIPMMFGADVIHGYRTIFPVPLAEAASFDPSLAERTSRVAAIEAAASGLDWTYAPMVDVARDARWGRGVEGAGEDVLLSSDMAAARVRGFQGKSLKDNDAVLACPKHFAAYGGAEAGLDYSSVDVSERSLREVYLPPFKSAFDAGALSTMAAFNEIAGIPASANPWLLTDVLHKEWKFDGFVVSDWGSDVELIHHGFAADGRDAARLAILAGVDMSMSSALYITHLPSLVASGEVPMSRVDEAVRRILHVKAELGLFENPYRRLDPARAKTRVFIPAHRALAREAAQRSIVLLKNDGDLLPLSPQGKRVALIGPFAEGPHDLVGPWTVFGVDAEAVDLATGLRRVITDPARLSVVKGSDIEVPIPGGIDAAVAAAKNADVVLLAIGESQDMTGESHSRSQIVMPPAQQALAEAVAKTGKPIVVLLKTGRSLALEGAVLQAQAIVVTWFLGTETGPAIADVLFGAASPSARLPVSFPRSPGQEPYHYDHKSSGRPTTSEKYDPFRTNFIDTPNAARFPFGYGLTYGHIAYSGFIQSTPSITANGSIEVSAMITNTGTRPATEVVQLYTRKNPASVTQPVRKLKAYKRVDLKPGESKKVSFTIAAADLAFLDQKLQPTIEPGNYFVWIAPSAEHEGVSGQFTLTRTAQAAR